MWMTTRVRPARGFTERLLASLSMAGLVVLWGCTEPNPDALADDQGSAGGDGGGAQDLSQPPGAVDLSSAPPTPDLSEPGGGRDMRRPEPDASSCPQGIPPPMGCAVAEQPDNGLPLQGQVRVDQYQGVMSTQNGQFEVFNGTLLCVSYVADSTLVDTENVQVSMKIGGMFGLGLPKEIPLMQGQVVEVEGEYIPAASAHIDNDNGPAAIITYTHLPCGFVVIDGMTYFGQRPHH